MLFSLVKIIARSALGTVFGDWIEDFPVADSLRQRISIPELTLEEVPTKISEAMPNVSETKCPVLRLVKTPAIELVPQLSWLD